MGIPDFTGLKRLFICFILLVMGLGFALGLLVSCQRPQGPEKAILSQSVSLILDTTTTTPTDSLMMVEGPKTVVVGGRKVKVGRGGTLIIQTAPNNVASVVGKAKAPLAVGPQAQAVEVEKPQNSAVSLGDNSPTSTSLPAPKNNWYWWLLGGVALSVATYLWLRTRK